MEIKARNSGSEFIGHIPHVQWVLDCGKKLGQVLGSTCIPGIWWQDRVHQKGVDVVRNVL